MRSENEQIQSLTEQACGQLRDDISCDIFPAGSRLNIESLKKRYVMGGTPIREALNQLVADQLVEALPLKGFRVAAMSIADAQDVMQTRELIELPLLTRARQRGDDYWESTLLGTVHRLKKGYFSESFLAEPDYAAGLRALSAFYAEVFGAGESPQLQRYSERLALHSRRYEYRLCCRQQDSALWLSYLDAVEQLLAALLAGDVRVAERVHQTQLHDLATRLQQGWEKDKVI